MIDKTNFDFEVNKPLSKLIEFANKKFPKRTWLIECIFWQDTDYELKLCSSWANKRDVFEYRRSHESYRYYQEKQRESKRWTLDLKTVKILF